MPDEDVTPAAAQADSPAVPVPVTAVPVTAVPVTAVSAAAVPVTAVDSRAPSESVPSESVPSESASSESAPTSRRRSRLGWTLLAAGALILLAAAWVGFRSLQAYRHLEAAKSTAVSIVAEFRDHGISRPGTLAGLAHRFAADAASARSAVQDPLFGAATGLPWLGDNLAAVRTVAVSIDEVATALEPGAALAGSLDAGHLFPHDGVVNMDTVQAAAGVLSATDTAVQQAIASLQAVDTHRLIGPVANAVTLLRDQLARAAPLTATGARLGSLVVPMLGGAGPRSYLVVFQNPAELRATGGIFGSYAVLRVDRGAITLQRTASTSRDLGTFRAGDLAVDPSLAALYSPRITSYPQDVNFTPDFPTAADLISSMYTQRFGQRVDGVIALDPLVVAQLLQGQRPIDLGNGAVLSSDTAAPLLMSDIYARFPTSVDTAGRDAFLGAATAAAFRAISSHQDPAAFRPIISGIKDMVDQRRVLVWSAHPDEERQILPTAVSGRLLRDAAGSPTTGVFLNDGTGGKLDYYLSMAARLAGGSCTGSSGSARLTVRLGFDAPATGLPNYVISGGNVGSSIYRLQTNVLLVAPTGGAVTNLLVDGRPVPVQLGADQQRAVAMVTVVMSPGQSVTVQARVDFPTGGAGTIAPRLVVTPMASTADTSADPIACLGDR